MPWATLEFPNITHSDRTPVEPDAISATRRKLARKQADPSRDLHVGHRVAWKHYIRGNVVSESSVALITNLLSTCSAMAHHNDDDEERHEEEKQQEKTPPWIAGSAKMTVPQLQTIIRTMSWVMGDKNAKAIAKILLASFQTGASMWSDTPRERLILRLCNNESGVGLATPLAQRH